MKACIEAGVNYLDFDDDLESTAVALAHDQAARETGIALLKGCGVSPGLSNVFWPEVSTTRNNV